MPRRFRKRMDYEDIPVFQIIVGRGEKHPHGVTGSVTLVIGKNKKILVDAGDPFNTQEVINCLDDYDVKPADIDIVVITHGHVDHCANMHLFKNATIYMDHDNVVQEKGIPKYESTLFPLTLDTNIEVHCLGGHTKNDLVVVVKSPSATTVIAGDLIEDSGNDGKKTATNVAKLKKAHAFIYALADSIIPGHGPIFTNFQKKELRVKK